MFPAESPSPRATTAGLRVLIVDDEVSIVDVLRAYLSADGFLVEHAYDGFTGLELARAGDFAVVLLDVNLPDISGTQLFERIRRDSDVPVIMITGRGEENERISGLERGADDYIAKPFSPREVVARVKTVLRRALSPPVGVALPRGARAGLVVERDAHRVTLDGAAVALTPTEFRLLELLERNRDRAFTRARLLDAIGGDRGEICDRTLDRHIANLRKKLGEGPDRPRFIETVVGVGYRFAARD